MWLRATIEIERAELANSIFIDQTGKLVAMTSAIPCSSTLETVRVTIKYSFREAPFCWMSSFTGRLAVPRAPQARLA